MPGARSQSTRQLGVDLRPKPIYLLPRRGRGAAVALLRPGCRSRHTRCLVVDARRLSPYLLR